MIRIYFYSHLGWVGSWMGRLYGDIMAQEGPNSRLGLVTSIHPSLISHLKKICQTSPYKTQQISKNKTHFFFFFFL